MHLYSINMSKSQPRARGHLHPSYFRHFYLGVECIVVLSNRQVPHVGGAAAAGPRPDTGGCEKTAMVIKV